MAMTPIDPAPARTDPAFEPYVDDFFGVKFPNFVDELNAAVTAFNNGSLTGTSTTSTPIDLTQAKVLTTQAGLSFVKGMWVAVMSQVTADTANAMYGVVRAYSGTSLTFDPKFITGSGTLANWRISIIPPIENSTTAHWAGVNTGNGYGSANTRVRNFTNVDTGSGTACTAAVSAINGASITINATGLYQVSYGEANPGVTGIAYVSKNSAALTTVPTQATQILSFDVVAGNRLFQGERLIRLTASDVLRPHPSVATFTGTTDCYFRCELIKTV